MVTYYQVRNGAIRFLDTEMLCKINDPTTKILMTAFLIASEKKSEKIYNTLKDNKLIKAYELIDDSGNIDIELAYDCFKKSMNNNNLTLQVPLMGKIAITPQDVEILRNYIIQADNTPTPPMFY